MAGFGASASLLDAPGEGSLTDSTGAARPGSGTKAISATGVLEVKAYFWQSA